MKLLDIPTSNQHNSRRLGQLNTFSSYPEWLRAGPCDATATSDRSATYVAKSIEAVLIPTPFGSDKKSRRPRTHAEPLLTEEALFVACEGTVRHELRPRAQV